MKTDNKKVISFDIRDFSTMRCPMHGLVSLLTGPWTTYILWLIRINGTLRFGQLKKQMPTISAKVLTARLRMLEEAGIIERHHEATIPPKVSYSFTRRGHELEALLDQINTLAVQWSGSEQTDGKSLSGNRAFSRPL
ncbi:helix-turn-helix domain-containing protein [Candidatus Methylospira mobilis]|nr:helix-turn-helix domain-containing protein [Candidatus Methylospira mobilis]WNV05092.1 helix-turn-helix domain-containing protein [Candidatus Methylospira mobilis]